MIREGTLKQAITLDMKTRVHVAVLALETSTASIHHVFRSVHPNKYW